MTDTSGSCGVCGKGQLQRWERGDGLWMGLCCLVVARNVADRHELARQIHRSVHGTDDPRCPKCRVDDAERMLWGDTNGGDGA